MRDMKDSGIKWIGEIPKEWNNTKIKYQLSKRYGGCWGEDETGENDFLCIRIADFNFINQTVRLDASTLRHYTKRQLNSMLQDGDIIIEKSGGGEKVPVGRTVLYNAKELPNAMFANFCDCLRPSHDISSKYLAFYLKALYQNVDMKLFFNQTTGLQNLNMQMYLNNKISIPPLEEQHLIANLLDKKCSEIDTLIQDIMAQIETLKEYKKSIITEAVTKGLDPKVEMKDSGIEWIGEIPKHWQVKRFKFMVNDFIKGNGITKEEVYEDGNIQCIRYGEIYTKYNGSFTETHSKTKLDKIKKQVHIEKGNLLFACTGELVDEIGKNIVYMGNEPCLAGGDIIIVKHNQNPIFLNYALNSSYSQGQKSFGKAKLKVVHISATALSNLLITFPPLQEQQQIAVYLDNNCSQIDQIIQDKQQQIDTLAEYKKSIIYEYVTGKKEVISDDQ